MAKTKTVEKPASIQTGTECIFKGYEDDAQNGTLKAGDQIRIVSFDADNETYNVETTDGRSDALFESEFTVATVATKAATKKVTTKKVASKKVATKVPSKKVASKKAVATVPGESEVVDKKSKHTLTAEPAKTKTKAKVKEDVEPLAPFKKTASVAKAIQEAGGDALTAAATVAEQKERTVFTLGGVLALVKRGDLQTSITERGEDGLENPVYGEGLRGFNAWASTELHIQPRMAHFYVSLYEKFSQLTTEAKLNKIGWTKLRELLPVNLDADNVEEWLNFTTTASTAEVRERVRTTLVAAGGKVHGNQSMAKQTTVKLVLHDDEAETFKAAIAEVQESLGDDTSVSKAVIHIIQEWMQARNMDESEEGEE